VETAQRGQWNQFQLSGGATPQSTNSRVLQDNRGLFGPAKLIARPGDCPICRLDVPEDLTGSRAHSFAFGDDVVALDPRIAWVRAVTDLATGSIRHEKPTPSSDDAMADELKQAGWSASVHAGRTTIHLQLPGVYRQLVLEHDQRSGVTLAVNLIELTGVADECLRAMLLLAQEANGQLPLVRLAVAESSQCAMLRAEVSFGSRLIPGAMFLQSLNVFEMVVALTAQELEALRDAELAHLVVSAAARQSETGTFCFEDARTTVTAEPQRLLPVPGRSPIVRG
jgi:hypothetical protein